ncbi:MAG TPA: hypothetical protein VM364_13825 [Vicinamibacterales bacterium]|nr:hypothetical protein [Vicinamibacterales bacterium]
MSYAFVVAALAMLTAAQAQHSSPGLFTQAERSPAEPKGAAQKKHLPADVTPYRSLFKVSPPKAEGPVTVVAVPQPSGKVIEHQSPGLERGPCGMPIIAADASGDPKIIVPIPEETKKASKIRVFSPPPPCGSRNP